MKYASIPFNQNQNGWSLNKHYSQPRPRLEGDIHVDWAIIGSGFAGIAFASLLAELNNNLNITIIDSTSEIESSSARNSGFIIGLPHNIGSSTAELRKAQTYRTLLQEGIRLLHAKVTVQIRLSVNGKTPENTTAR